MVPSGLKLKKQSAILPVLFDFEEKWKLILKEAEKRLVEKLLVESDKIIASIKTQIQFVIKDINPCNFLREPGEIERKHAQFKHQLEQRKRQKWQKFRERDRGSFTSKINNRLAKGSSVTLKTAKDP